MAAKVALGVGERPRGGYVGGCQSSAWRGERDREAVTWAAAKAALGVMTLLMCEGPSRKDYPTW
eukprot:SAG11_NODE_7917_length_1081_cov_0.984725_1_plen_63_part_01